MTTKNCLNCEKKLTDQFCSGCGQKADTHRITFKNFIFHDLLHGTFHIEKGILFTAKEALLRPGKAALDYISGKRKRYYNVFYLVLLTIGVMLFSRHIDELFNHTEIIQDASNKNEATRKLDEIFSQMSKFLMLLFIPASALNGFILFRRRKLNLSEHFIIAGMLLLGILLINIVANIMFYVNWITQFDEMFLSLCVTAACFLYTGYGYFNAFGTHYSKWGIAYRIALYFALICLEAYILLLILIGFVTNWEFTLVTVAPFG